MLEDFLSWLRDQSVRQVITGCLTQVLYHHHISKTTKNLSLLDTFHHFSAVQQAHKITQVESTRKWTSGITDNIIISSNYKLNTKRIFSISYLSYLLCHHSCIAAARCAPLHYCPS